MTRTQMSIILLAIIMACGAYNIATAKVGPDGDKMTEEQLIAVIRSHRDSGHPEAHMRADAALLEYIGIEAVTDAHKQMGRD